MTCSGKLKTVIIVIFYRQSVDLLKGLWGAVAAWTACLVAAIKTVLNAK